MRRLIASYIAPRLVSMPAHRVAEFGAQYRPYGWFGVGNAILFYIALHYYSPTLYDNLGLRLGCIIFSSLLIVHARWPARCKPLLPLYWYVTVLVTLPTFFTYMLIMNHFTPVWAATTIAVIFFIHMLMDFVSALFLLALGTVLGVLSAVCVLYLTVPHVALFPSTFEYFGFFLLYLVANGIVAIFSRNRQKQEQYQRALIRAEAESEEKSEFIANMSHDLRMALTGIASVAEQEAAHIACSHPMYDSWQMVHQASQQLHDFVEDILLTAKFGTVTTLEEPEAFVVIEMIRSVVTLLKPAWRQKQLRCQIIPQNFEPLPILRSHPVLLQRLLLNLLNNAVKFTEAHGDITIAFELRRAVDDCPPQLILSVRDTGIGIAKANHTMIFQSFRRVVPAYKQSSHQGNGLGLYMVNKILALLHGHIAIDSQLGEGSVFTCTIPVEVEYDKAVTTLRQQAQVA